MTLADVSLALPTWELLGRIGLAFALGAVVGIEREIDAQSAGFRTHVLIALGACLFGLVSIHAFEPFTAARDSTNVNVDITRVASQVVVGVGFLGGGAILKGGVNVRGLTTAASIWVTAAVGLAAGLGYWSAALVTTLAVLASLVVLRWGRGWVRRRFGRSVEVVSIRLRPGSNTGPILERLHALPDVSVRQLSVDRDTADRTVSLVATLKSEPRVDLGATLAELAQREEVEALGVEER